MQAMYYSASTGGFYSAAIRCNNMPDDVVQISLERYKQLIRGQANGRKIVPDAFGFPKLSDRNTIPLDVQKQKKIATAWSIFKQYQRERVDPEDLILAANCAAGGSAKGMAVQGWVLNLWATYYTIKDAIEISEDPTTLNSIRINPHVCGELPCTIKELNEEAASAVL